MLILFSIFNITSSPCPSQQHHQPAASASAGLPLLLGSGPLDSHRPGRGHGRRWSGGGRRAPGADIAGALDRRAARAPGLRGGGHELGELDVGQVQGSGLQRAEVLGELWVVGNAVVQGGADPADLGQQHPGVVRSGGGVAGGGAGDQGRGHGPDPSTRPRSTPPRLPHAAGSFGQNGPQ